MKNEKTIYYFSGMSYQDMKRRLNVDLLFSQWHERKGIRSLIEYKKEHPEHTGRIMVDSGSFTAYTKGVHIDIDDYLKFIDEIGDYVTVFVAVDDVPDPMNMDYNKAKTTWDNYLYMVERIRPELRDKLIPVFHYGEDFKWLRNMLEYRHPDGSPIKYIGLAISLEGTKKVRINWGRECMRVIHESSNPNVMTHAFGVGVKSVLDNITVTSTDATSWVKRAAYGMIAVDDKSIHVSEVMKAKADDRSLSQQSKALQEDVLKRIKQRGFTLEELEQDSGKRAEFNILDTLDWVAKLEPHNTTFKNGLGW